MLKLFSLNKLLEAILGSSGLGTLLAELIGRFGFTDLLGLIVDQARKYYSGAGRAAVIRMVTIKRESLERWARQVHGRDQVAVANVIDKWAALAEAFANVVESLIPRRK